MKNAENYFTELKKVNVSDKTEKVGHLTFVSWAHAWDALKTEHPEATSMVYENEKGQPYFVDEYSGTGWVKVGVSLRPAPDAEPIEHIEYLAIMVQKGGHRSAKLEEIDSMLVMKTIQRAITKAIARHGIGIGVYAGEDIPKEETAGNAVKKTTYSTKPLSPEIEERNKALAEKRAAHEAKMKEQEK